jgi:hypothetical protein
MSYIAELIIGLIFTIFVWLILFPIALLLATPVILIISLFSQHDRYAVRVRRGYRQVFEFWLDYGLWCMP